MKRLASSSTRTAALIGFAALCLASSASAQFFYNPANGHYYTLTAGPVDLATARAQAAALGGKLASIANASEQAFIATTFTAELAVDALWIGMNDEANEGTFVWEDGTPFIFTNWYPGEPNNSAGLEDGGTMLSNAELNLWNDAPAFFAYVGVVEIVPTTGDTCVTAPVISGDAIVPYDSTSCTVPGAASAPCSGIGGGDPTDFWVKYVAPLSGTLTISNCSGSANAPGGYSIFGTDTYLAGWSGGSVEPTTYLTCADDSCGYQSEIAFSVVAGQTYYAQIGTWGGPATCSGALAFHLNVMAPNDVCATAQPIFDGVNGPFDNFSAADTSWTTGVCDYVGADVWFSYTASSTRTVRFSTETPAGATPGSLNDPDMEIYSSCGGAVLACVDGNPYDVLTTNLALTAGQTIYIRMSGWLAQQGTFYLTATPRFTLEMTSPLGPGSIEIRNLAGDANTVYFSIFTLSAGAFPNGWLAGIDPTLTEVLIQASAYTAPFIGVLDGNGRSDFGPYVGFPPLTLYGVTFFFGPAGNILGVSRPVAHTIP